MPTDRPRAHALAADVEAWLAELGVAPVGRAVRDAITSWDLVVDGRKRFDIRATLILDPALAAIVWIHYAPPLNDSFRASYQRLLRWNDQYPFAKFALGEDLRLVLTAELPTRTLDRDELGLALARLLAICDQLFEESRAWLDEPAQAKGRQAAEGRGAERQAAERPAQGSGGSRGGLAASTETERVSRQVGLFARYADQLGEFSP